VVIKLDIGLAMPAVCYTNTMVCCSFNELCSDPRWGDVGKVGKVNLDFSFRWPSHLDFTHHQPAYLLHMTIIVQRVWVDW